jgi:hypothetical protein
LVVGWVRGRWLVVGWVKVRGRSLGVGWGWVTQRKVG